MDNPLSGPSPDSGFGLWRVVLGAAATVGVWAAKRLIDQVLSVLARFEALERRVEEQRILHGALSDTVKELRERVERLYDRIFKLRE